MWPVTDRFHTAAAGSHHRAVKLEVWSLGTKLGEASPDTAAVGGAYFKDGSVTDEFVIGVRRQLSLTVPQNTTWLEWLTKPALELRPFTGIDFGGHIEWCPHGRFIVKARPRTLRPGTLSLKANDFWERVKDATFVDTRTYGGMAFELRGIIRQFISETGPYIVSERATSTAIASKEYVWEKPRHETIVELCQSIGATAYFDREGVPVIEDWRPSSNVLALRDNLIDVAIEISWVKVYNVVSAKSTAQNVSFPAQVASITDTLNPAHRSTLGGDVVKTYSSPLLLTPEQALSAAYTLLWKLSAPARTMSLSIVPNPALDAGDAITVEWPGATDGPVPGVVDEVRIQSVTHPLGGGAQKIVAMATGGPSGESDLFG